MDRTAPVEKLRAALKEAASQQSDEMKSGLKPAAAHKVRLIEDETITESMVPSSGGGDYEKFERSAVFSF